MRRNLFEGTGYPDAAKHKKQHDALAKQVLHLQKNNRDGDAALSVDVLKLLGKWLINHMQTSDTKYVLYLNEKGIKHDLRA